MGSDEKVFAEKGPFFKWVSFWINLIDKPVVWVRENIVVPNRQEYYWYHEKFRRVPTVDECYTDDHICIYEAEEQYKRDKKVETYIIKILRKRYEYCLFENSYDRDDCNHLKEAFDKAAVNFFIKYGELGMGTNAVRCLMKQKNRMAWERRNGPIGSGKKPVDEDEMWKNKKEEMSKDKKEECK